MNEHTAAAFEVALDAAMEGDPRALLAWRDAAMEVMGGQQGAPEGVARQAPFEESSCFGLSVSNQLRPLEGTLGCGEGFLVTALLAAGASYLTLRSACHQAVAGDLGKLERGFGALPCLVCVPAEERQLCPGRVDFGAEASSRACLGLPTTA